MNLRTLLRRYLAPHGRLILVLIVLQSIQTIATLTLPNLSGRVIDEGVMRRDQGAIWRIGLVMMGMSLVQIVFSVLAVRIGARIAMSVGRDVRRDLFHKVNEFSAREVGKFGAPSLITRTTNDVQQVQTLLVMALTAMVAAPLTAVFGIFAALREDVKLSVVLLVAVPVTAIVLGSVILQMVPAFQKMQVRIDQVNSVLREQITGIRVVRAFVREEREAQRFSVANADLTAVSLRAGRMMAFMFPSVWLIVNMSMVAVLWIGSERVDTGDLAIGSLSAYLVYLVQVLMSVMMVTFMMSMIPRAAVSAERINEVLDTESSVKPPTNPVRDLPEHATVEFRDVGFQYAGAAHAVLNDISFRCGPGQTTAIIGSTGAGKTTIVNLVSRLVDATSGEVMVDGVNVREIDPAVLAGKIGYVPQKAFLFSGTVASNLRFGRPDATDEELWQALEIAQAAGFVRNLPEGLNAPVAQGGTNFSGGQRQRLTIARAITVNPEIYVFDDSFSALDLTTDARLRAALRPHTRDAAVIVVAQRVSTIRDADQILVVEDGEIVGRGTHDELIATCPTYLEIVESQHAEGQAA